MRYKSVSSCGILVAVLAFSPMLFAQTNEQSGPAKEPSAASAFSHDLSGIWMEYLDGPNAIDQKSRPPLTAWGQARFDAASPQLGPRAVAGKENDPSVTRCQPEGLPKALIHPNPFEIVQVPGRVFMFFEEHHVWRTIWTDGRPLPKNPAPNWLGYSVGKWEGDTFVVDTIGLNDKSWVDSYGNPRSEQMHITERYRRLNHDTLEMTLTMDDPKAYTKIWANPPKLHKLETSWELAEFVCTLDEEKAYDEKIIRPAGGAHLPK